MSKTSDMLLMELRDPDGRDIVGIIRDAYAAGKSGRRAAQIMGIDPVTLYNWMRRLGLEVRSELVCTVEAAP